jgi:hypothetical protein
MVPVQINDNGYCNGRFGSGNGNNEQGKENAIQLIGVQVFIKSDEVDVHTVQHQLNGHQHGDQVAPREQAVHANKEQGSAYK